MTQDMEREPGIKWLFLDLDSYFASVEQQERPALRGKPVAVTPMPSEYTCVIAASREAKAYGIKTGTLVRDARKMCPNLVCLPARHEVYVAYHNRIIEEVVRYTPINKIWSIDELSSCLPPSRRSIEAATKTAMQIKSGLRRNIGAAISCSVGLAPNSLLGKIASDMNKPDGLKILRQEDLPGPLLDLTLTDLPGVGRNMERRLIAAGVRSINDLWHTSPKQARKIWTGVQGERFWYWLHGYDFDAPETHPSTIGHSRILDPELRAPEKARLMARSLLARAAFRLRRKNLYAAALSFDARTCDNLRWSGETRFSPARDPFTFLYHLEMLWNDMLHNFLLRNSPLPRFKKVSVSLHRLSEKEEICADLFETQQQENAVQAQKRESLTCALDALREKYHKDVVSLGVPPKTTAGYIGTKIAFSRVPEQEEFWS